MIINHPLLGPRDSQEFTYLGDVKLMKRPNSMSKNADKKFFDYLYSYLIYFLNLEMIMIVLL